VDQLFARQIFPPQVTQASFQLEQPNKDYPITLTEALKVFPHNKHKKMKEHPVESNQNSETTIVDIEKVKFSYKTITRSRKTVLKEINLKIQHGDRIALVGNNGAG